MTEREQKLDRRVRWLDRMRRGIAIVAGVLVALGAAYEMAQVMDDDWPPLHAGALSLALGFVGWLVTEIAFAAALAFWESELAGLERGGLPRATLRVRRRK